MDDCLSRIIVQSIKDELGHWDELKEEQCGSGFVYVSPGEIQHHDGYATPGRDEIYPTEGCSSPFSAPSHCDPQLGSPNGPAKRDDWGAGPNQVIVKQERLDESSVPFHGSDRPVGDARYQPLHDSPGDARYQPLHDSPGDWNGGSFHPPCHPPVEYIELKPKVVTPPPSQEGAEDSGGGGDDKPSPPPPEHRPELAYVLVERLPLRVIQAWLPQDRLAPMAARGKRRHLSLSLETKLRILSDVARNSLPKKDIAIKYEIPPSTLSTLIRNREKIEDSFMLGGSPTRYRARGAKHKEVEAKLFERFTDWRALNVRVTGQMLQEEAGRIATRMRVEDFAASSGWLWRFQKRYNIAAHSPLPGPQDPDAPPTPGAGDVIRDEWLRSFRHLLDSYSQRDTFAADEVALYYNCTPERAAALRHTLCHAGERSKDRLTVALACNADGSERLRPLVVGKFTRPRCFGRVGDRADLPCVYRSSKRSWMTGGIFAEWLATLQRRMEESGRKILLVLDNCKAHSLDGVHYPNVRVLLLPPDVSHPLSRGVGHAFKRSYRQRLLRHYLQQVRSGCSPTALRKWDTLEAMENIAASWAAVSPSTIRRGWEEEGCEVEGEDCDLTVDELTELGVSSFDSLVRVDDDVATSCVYEDVSLPSLPTPPPPTGEELRRAVGVLDRVAAAQRLPAKVLRAIRVLDRFVADASEPTVEPPAEAWSRQTV